MQRIAYVLVDVGNYSEEKYLFLYDGYLLDHVILTISVETRDNYEVKCNFHLNT